MIVSICQIKNLVNYTHPPYSSLIAKLTLHFWKIHMYIIECVETLQALLWSSELKYNQLNKYNKHCKEHYVTTEYNTPLYCCE